MHFSKQRTAGVDNPDDDAGSGVDAGPVTGQLLAKCILCMIPKLLGCAGEQLGGMFAEWELACKLRVAEMQNKICQAP